MSKLPDSPNKHLYEYLDYYLSFNRPPHFAVMLNGEWGIGKTFLLKRYLSSSTADKERVVYVSLYGISSVDEIDRAILQAIMPEWANKDSVKKTAMVATRLGTAALKYFGAELEVKAKDVLGFYDTTNKIFVFDDLERCKLSPDEAMGYINNFVEHEGCKVIVVANEKEIREGETYQRVKEKLVGKTLEIQSSLNEALQHFISQISDSTVQQFFRKHIELISNIHSQSKLNNLRILQQTLWDFERFLKAIPKKYLSHTSAMNALLHLFFALSYELKSGRILPEHLTNRMETIVAAYMDRKKDNPKHPLDIANERYSFDLSDAILSDAVLTNVLQKGIIDPIQIRECLANSEYFLNTVKDPTWKSIWYFFQLTEDKFAEKVSIFETEMIARKYQIPVEMLHVFGLRLWLAKNEMISLTASQVKQEAIDYIDELFAANTLPPAEPNSLNDIDLGYQGLAIYERETDEFAEINQHMNQRQVEAYTNRYSDFCNELVQDLNKGDSDSFFRKLAYTSDGNNSFARIPLLTHLPAEVFVTKLMSLHPLVQKNVMMTFEARYQAGALERDLAPEKAWLADVKAQFEKQMAISSPIVRYRMKTMFNRGMGKHLQSQLS